MFDAVLDCLDAQFDIDWNHIHSIGFSAGGIMTDLLGTNARRFTASTVSFSGGYFSNPANAGQTMNMVTWPSFTGTHSYPQLFAHGGATDSYSLMVTTIHFDQMAANDTTFLNQRGHDAILCNHNSGIPCRWECEARPFWSSSAIIRTPLPTRPTQPAIAGIVPGLLQFQRQEQPSLTGCNTY